MAQRRTAGASAAPQCFLGTTAAPPLRRRLQHNASQQAPQQCASPTQLMHTHNDLPVAARQNAATPHNPACLTCLLNNLRLWPSHARPVRALQGASTQQQAKTLCQQSRAAPRLSPPLQPSSQWPHHNPSAPQTHDFTSQVQTDLHPPDLTAEPASTAGLHSVVNILQCSTQHAPRNAVCTTLHTLPAPALSTC